MNRLFILLFIYLSSTINLNAQEMPETCIEIKNSIKALKQNKVSSITHTKYYYKDNKKELTYETGNKILTELFDSLGRKVEVIYYIDSTAEISNTIKYQYADTIGIAIYMIETYDSGDSLVNVKEAKEENGEMIYFRIGSGVSCFGNYKFIYNNKGLIEEAIWYGPKKGIWANKHMIANYTTRLSYTFNLK